MAEGWISLNRSLFDNELWTSEPFSRGQAWVDLLLLANHKDSYFYKRGNKITVKRGQLGRSCVELSDRWKWSRNKVNKFLKDLEKEQQIKVVKTSITQVVTIVNYDKFQAKGQQIEQRKDSERTAKGQRKDTYNNDNNVNNENNEKKEGEFPLELFPKTEGKTVDHEKQEVFDLWINYRKEIKKKITVKSTLDNLIDKFNKHTLQDCTVAVNSSIDNQYTGLFFNKNNHGDKQQNKQELINLSIEGSKIGY